MLTEDNWVVYILFCGDNTLYCGCSNDVNKRLEAHKKGKASKYTRARLPVSLVACSPKMSKSAAMKLEYKIKQLPKDEKITALRSKSE